MADASQSISTHDSFGLDVPSDDQAARQGRRPSARPAPFRLNATVGTQKLRMSAASARLLCDQEARQLLSSSEAQIKQEEKIERARRLREKFHVARESRCGSANRRRAETSSKMQQQRWEEEGRREDVAFKQRRSSEEQAMLRQVGWG